MSIENDDIDLGKAIFIPTKTKKSPTDTKTSYGIAKSDSSNGSVTVDMLGLTSGDSQDVEIPCTCAVKEGERVIVTIVGTDPIVTGVAGWGDLVQKDAEDALSQAKAAVKQVDVEYAVGDSQSTAPTSGWSTSTPEWTSGKYIWQRTVISTSDGTTYSDPTCIQGAQGEAGKDGTSVTVESTSTTYQSSTSGTTTPTGAWKTTIPSVAAGSYLWTKTVVTYSDGTSTETFTVALQGKTGSKGSSGTTYYTWIKYADTPTSGMSDNPDGKAYLGVAYNKTTATESTTYSDYSWSLIKGATGDKGDKGDTGAKGEDGNGISDVTYLYARTTTQTQPAASAITSTTIPTLDATNKYLWQKETTTFTNGTTQINIALLGVYGDTGKQGDKGDTGATGATGATGKGISSITPQYYLSTSSSSATGGSWKTSPPTYVSGRYYWTRNKIVWQNPTSTTYTTAVYDPSLTEALSSVVQLKTLIREDETYGVEVGKSTDGTTFTGIHTTMGADKFAIHAKDHTELATFSESEIELSKNSDTATINMLAGAVKINAEKNTYEGEEYTFGRMQTDGADAVGLQASDTVSGVIRRAYVEATKDPTTGGYPATNIGAIYNQGTGDLSKINQASLSLRGSQDTALASLIAVNAKGSKSSPSISLMSTESVSKMSLTSKTTSLNGESKALEVSTDKIINCLSNHSKINIYIGSKVVNASDTSAVLFDSTEFKSNFGLEVSDVLHYFAAAMNGDGDASQAHCQDCTYLSNLLYVTFDRRVQGPFRANYIVVTSTE